MLNKAICINCINDYATKEGDSGHRWHPHDESSWKKNKEILCPPYGYIPTQWLPGSITEIPEHCPKKFEHLVAAGMKNAK